MQVLPTATICRDSVALLLAQQHHPLSWSDTVSPHCKQTTRQEEDIYNFTMYSLHCIDQIVFIKLYSFHCIHQISFRGRGRGTFCRLQIVYYIHIVDIGQCAAACVILLIRFCLLYGQSLLKVNILTLCVVSLPLSPSSMWDKYIYPVLITSDIKGSFI